MISIPIVVRELSVASRRRSTYGSRSFAALGALLGASWLLVFGATLVSTVEQGRDLFLILSFLCFGFAVLAGVALTADSVSSEKRDGTLGLLFLTDLKGYDIVFGKLVSSSISSAYALLGIAPILALATLLGGVSWQEIVRVILSVGAMLMLSLSAGILVSSLSKNERKAMFAAVLLILGVGLVPLELRSVLDLWLNITVDALLFFSPFYTMEALAIRQSAGLFAPWTDFFIGIGWMLSYATLLLLLASAIVPRVCRDRPSSARALAWRAKAEFWSYGAAQVRQRYRAALLDRNPFLWLASRDRLKRNLTWFFLGMMLVIWLYCYYEFPEVIFSPILTGGLILVVFGFFKIWMASEICSRFMEDRRSGALELLLSTPLEVPQILRGSAMALRRQFGQQLGLLLSAAAVLVACGLEFDMEFSQPARFISCAAALIQVIPDLIAIYWLGISHSLRSKSVSHSLLLTVGRVLLAPWCVFGAIFVAVQGWNSVSGRPDPLPGQAWVLFWLGLSLANDFWIVRTARNRIYKNFRDIAAGSPDEKPASYIVRLLRGVRSFFASPKATLQRICTVGFLRRHWAGGTVLALALLCVIGFPLYRLHLRSDISRQIRDLQKAGIPTTYDELFAGQPPVSREDNGAPLLLLANNQVMAAFPPWMYANRNIFAEKSDPRAPSGGLSKLLAEIQQALSNNVAALDTFRQAAQFPRWRLDPGSVTGPMGIYQWIGRIGPIGKLLSFRILLSAEAGDSNAVARDLELMLRAAQRSSEMSGAEGGMVSRFFERPLWDALEFALSEVPMTDTELARLQVLCELTGRPHLTNSIAFDAVQALSMFQAPISELASRMGGVPRGQLKLYFAIENVKRLTGQWDRDYRNFVTRLNACVPIFKKSFPACLDELEKTLPLRAGAGPRFGFSPFFNVHEALSQSIRRRVFMEADRIANCRLAATAIAIKRYSLAHDQRLPDSLDNLVPLYLAEVPQDPFDAQPLRYRKAGSGYILYSVGPDRIDSHGERASYPNVPLEIGSSYDIVWKIKH